MASRSNHHFHGNVNKQTLRRMWDRAILQRHAATVGRRLAYFGLPGPDIQDILDWRDLLVDITGVERLRSSGQERQADLEAHRRLLVNVNIHDVPNFQLLRGFIEDVIRDTLDQDGIHPKRNDGQPAHKMHFLYDVVNLDYLGGIGYSRNAGGSARQVAAIKKLFERQQGTSFVLLMTLNVRDKLGKEIDSYLEHMSERVDDDCRDVLLWHAKQAEGLKRYKLKALLPLFIRGAAEHNGFRCHAYPPVWYKGTGGEEMVHFAFVLTHEPNISFQAFGLQLDYDLLNLPLMRVDDGMLTIDKSQRDGFDFTYCEESLMFLDQNQRNAILEHLRVL